MTTTTPLTDWSHVRDDYGRECLNLRRITVDGTTIVGRIVKLPKDCQARYLANDWTASTFASAAVTYHDTLAAAKAHLLAVVR